MVKTMERNTLGLTNSIVIKGIMTSYSIIVSGMVARNVSQNPQFVLSNEMTMSDLYGSTMEKKTVHWVRICQHLGV